MEFLKIDPHLINLRLHLGAIIGGSNSRFGQFRVGKSYDATPFKDDPRLVLTHVLFYLEGRTHVIKGLSTSLFA